jgi:hypothetical protein
MLINHIGMFIFEPFELWYSDHAGALLAHHEVWKWHTSHRFPSPELHSLELGADMQWHRHNFPFDGGNSALNGAFVGALLGYSEIVVTGVNYGTPGYYYNPYQPHQYTRGHLRAWGDAKKWFDQQSVAVYTEYDGLTEWYPRYGS